MLGIDGRGVDSTYSTQLYSTLHLHADIVRYLGRHCRRGMAWDGVGSLLPVHPSFLLLPFAPSFTLIYFPWLPT